MTMYPLSNHVLYGSYLYARAGPGCLAAEAVTCLVEELLNYCCFSQQPPEPVCLSETKGVCPSVCLLAGCTRAPLRFSPDVPGVPSVPGHGPACPRSPES